jgi:hypothetical protein
VCDYTALEELEVDAEIYDFTDWLCRVMCCVYQITIFDLVARGRRKLALLGHCKTWDVLVFSSLALCAKSLATRCPAVNLELTPFTTRIRYLFTRTLRLEASYFSRLDFEGRAHRYISLRTSDWYLKDADDGK